MKILKKLWSGEYSLVKTYWVFYVLMWNLTLLPLAIFRQLSQNTQDSYLILGLLFAIIFVTYGCIVIVGLWRSANKYGGWWLWANLVKVVVVIGVLTVAISIFGALQMNLMVGIVLLLSALVTLTIIKFYETDGCPKNIKIFVGVCLALLLLLVAAIALNPNLKSSVEKSKWMPLTNSMLMNYSKDKLEKQTTYLDFNSITEKNGRFYAYIANEYMDGEQFKNSSKQYYEFNCSTPPKLRILSVVTYKNKVEEGFGAELGRNDDLQSTLAKSAVANGRAYTGGWGEYDYLQRDIFKYCENSIATSIFDINVNKSLCDSARRELTILKAVCEAK